MKDISQWRRIAPGLYKYPIAHRLCYEIHIVCADVISTLPAIVLRKESIVAELYLVGIQRNATGQGYTFVRKMLDSGDLQACLDAAVEDDAKYN